MQNVWFGKSLSQIVDGFQPSLHLVEDASSGRANKQFLHIVRSIFDLVRRGDFVDFVICIQSVSVNELPMHMCLICSYCD